MDAISSTPLAAHNLHLQTTTQEGGTHFYLKPKTEKCVCVFCDTLSWLFLYFCESDRSVTLH